MTLGGEHEELSVQLIVPQSRIPLGTLATGELCWSICRFYPNRPPRGSWSSRVMADYLAETAVYAAWEPWVDEEPDEDDEDDDKLIFLSLSERPRERLLEPGFSGPIGRRARLDAKYGDPSENTRRQALIALADADNSSHEQFLNSIMSSEHHTVSICLFPSDRPPSPWGGVRSEMVHLEDREEVFCALSFPVTHCYFLVRPITEAAGWDWGQPFLDDKFAWFADVDSELPRGKMPFRPWKRGAWLDDPRP